MIRHRFGGILRAARTGILCRRPSRTATPETRESLEIQTLESSDPRTGGNGQRMTGLDLRFGRATDAPTEIERDRPADQ
jgi:hypothetical protein